MITPVVITLFSASFAEAREHIFLGPFTNLKAVEGAGVALKEEKWLPLFSPLYKPCHKHVSLFVEARCDTKKGCRYDGNKCIPTVCKALEKTKEKCIGKERITVNHKYTKEMKKGAPATLSPCVLRKHDITGENEECLKKGDDRVNACPDNDNEDGLVYNPCSCVTIHSQTTICMQVQFCDRAAPEGSPNGLICRNRSADAMADILGKIAAASAGDVKTESEKKNSNKSPTMIGIEDIKMHTFPDEDDAELNKGWQAEGIVGDPTSYSSARLTLTESQLLCFWGNEGMKNRKDVVDEAAGVMTLSVSTKVTAEDGGVRDTAGDGGGDHWFLLTVTDERTTFRFRVDNYQKRQDWVDGIKLWAHKTDE